MSGARVIALEDESDRWRYTCPNGHTSWEPTNHHFFCASCARRHGVDPSFDALRDRQDGSLLAREEVRLEDDFGPYDRELDAGGASR